MGRFGALLLAVAVLAAAASVALAAQSPRQLRASIFTAARAQHSVHYVTLIIESFRARIVGDVSADRGIQRITFGFGPMTGHLTVRVVGRTAYLRGDAFTLHMYLEFSPSQASRYQGRWISIPHASKGYSTIAAAVTLRSFLSELYPKGKRMVAVSGTVNGTKVVGVQVAGLKAGLHVVSTLYAQAHGTPLPVQEHEIALGRGYESWETIGRWNEAVDVRAPAHAVPISKVAAS
jgi:hypothetical protein